MSTLPLRRTPEPASAMRQPLGGKLRPSSHLCRAVFAKVRASVEGYGNAEAIAKQMWPGDEPTLLILKGSVPVATTGNAPWAGVLAASSVADFVSSLSTYGAAARIIDAGVRVSFDGVNLVSVPRRATAVDAALAWIAEGQP